jgi:hypothetical protein
MTLKFKEYDVVALKRAVPTIPLPVGQQGTIVSVNSTDLPGNFAIEFNDGPGNLGIYDVSGDDLELVCLAPKEEK